MKSSNRKTVQSLVNIAFSIIVVAYIFANLIIGFVMQIPLAFYLGVSCVFLLLAYLVYHCVRLSKSARRSTNSVKH